MSEFAKACCIEIKVKRIMKQFFYRLQVGSEDLSVHCSPFLLRNVAKSQNKEFSFRQNFQLGRYNITMLDEWVWGRVGKCCLCRAIMGHLFVDSLTGSLIRTVKFQVNDSSLYTNSAFCRCNCWTGNAIIDGHCQLLKWMGINIQITIVRGHNHILSCI